MYRERNDLLFSAHNPEPHGIRIDSFVLGSGPGGGGGGGGGGGLGRLSFCSHHGCRSAAVASGTANEDMEESRRLLRGLILHICARERKALADLAEAIDKVAGSYGQQEVLYLSDLNLLSLWTIQLRVQVKVELQFRGSWSNNKVKT